MLWDIFCRVVDNFGDIGVCWRLACDLGTRQETVRMWVDDASALRWMAPQGSPGVEVVGWTDDAPPLDAGDVVIEAFGCDPPPAFVHRMTLTDKPPVWINLEYLSAQEYVERSHGLPSPQLSGPGAGLSKWFFYPGFTERTGGLLREQALMALRLGFHRDAWLAAHGLSLRPNERVVSLFCYPNAGIGALLDALADRPTLLLAAPGAAHGAVGGDRGGLRVHELPWLTQADYDRLLWAGDLNFVRGEDSFVRAQWAGAPFVWQIYPQHDAVHAAKLDAFLDRFGADDALRRLWHGWNGLAPWDGEWPDWDAWTARCHRWRESLLAQGDLCTQLIGFAEAKRLE